MHFGLDPYIKYVEYFVFVASFLLSVFWRPVVGIFYLLPLIPLQTIRYRLNDLPLGESVVGIILLGVVLGLLRRGLPVFPRTPWTKVLCVYTAFTFLSLFLGSFYLRCSLPLPGDPRFGVWQDYITMPSLLLLTAATAPSRREMRAIVLVMCLATFVLNHNFWDVVSARDFSTFSDDLREGSNMGYAGTNGLAAFEAQVASFLLAMGLFERKSALRLGYYALAAFSALCLTYSLSRGGYVAMLVGCLFLGIVKQRKLLILLAAFCLTWTSLVPAAVQQRVLMTYDPQRGSLDNSAATRLSIWDNAVQVFDTNVALGTGFNTYAYMHLNKRTDGGEGYYEDTHNFFLKVLVETGVIGMIIFLWLLAKTFGAGYMLFRRARDSFFASLGLGLAAWLICSIAANFFGDRWTFLQVNGYMWVLGGLVSRAGALEQSRTSAAVGDGSADAGIAGQQTLAAPHLEPIKTIASLEGMRATTA